GGAPSRTLMQRAGKAAARQIIGRFGDRLYPGVTVFAGPGNNGGDGWVVAGELARAGVPVHVPHIGGPKTPEAIAEREDALKSIEPTGETFFSRLVVDALLGTGFRGAPRSELAAAIATINQLRASGYAVASLDVPSGLDATTGEHGECVHADVTLSFGALKRGTLLARDCCGEIVVIDIGLDEASPRVDESLPLLVDQRWVAERMPSIRFDAHKGQRKHLAIVGGGSGMGGAAVLAARAALRSGIGLVRAVVAASNTNVVLLGAPAALVSEWPDDRVEIKRDIGEWADAIVLGPGMGRSREAEKLMRLVIEASRQPLLLDADALNLFENDVSSLRGLLAGRQCLVTPHPAEFARLAGTDVKTVLAERFDIGTSLAADLGATVLLKGAPTIIFSPTGERLVSPRGTAALGTGGTGDILAGIAGTLLAQAGDPVSAGGCAAWAHGKAAELCAYVRGTTLEDVLYALPRVWNEKEPPLDPPVIARLPAAAQ
ncbi:MAG TPA: NAD(P)H-hydrate dehydratase, partial [Gemmatimonadaceae bacterium]|nr:NAD(P)H-hydrate dehydratase [Gemmatimonadaceae bacterium]